MVSPWSSSEGVGQLSRIVRALDAVLAHGLKHQMEIGMGPGGGGGGGSGAGGQVVTFFTRNWNKMPGKGKDKHGRELSSDKDKGQGARGRASSRDRNATSGSADGQAGGTSCGMLWREVA